MYTPSEYILNIVMYKGNVIFRATRFSVDNHTVSDTR